ncbi:hypothetical protein MMC11_004872 [Xylographa trunciseda]|nr:hypothetical protein [Xylographa trunciseda]
MPALPAIDPTIVSVIRDDLRLTTWLLLGASLQSLLVLCLPTPYAVLPAVLLLSYRIIKVSCMTAGLIHDTTQDQVVKGRFTAQLCPGESFAAKQASEEEVVIFIIGARSNQSFLALNFANRTLLTVVTTPLSRFAPGFLQAGDYFQSMWKEAEADPMTCGYLGRSSDMLATDDETGKAIITLSYWRSMAHLHAFARRPAHRAGWDWFNRMTQSHPHLGMMHEVYAMPKGHWENIHKNFTPFGMGQIKRPVQGETVLDEK